MIPFVFAQIADIVNRYWRLMALVMVGLFVVYVLHLRSEVTALKIELATSQAQLQQYKDDMAKVVKAHDDLKKKEEELKRKSEGFVDPIERNGKSPLSKQALDNPAEVRRQINESIRKALECLEKATSGGEC